MKIYVSSKRFFKEAKEVQKAIIDSIPSLYIRIKEYENQNIPFEQIFNDDKVKYDQQGQFYTYKCQKATLQLRILYSYLSDEDGAIILIENYVNKKKNNKEYIKQFEYAKKLDPREVLAGAKLVTVIEEGN